VFVSCAAVSDWKPKETAAEKVTTHGTDTLTLELVPTKKIIDDVKERHPETYLVAFRAQHNLTPDDLINDAFARLQKAHADLIAVNDVSHRGTGFETDTNELFVVDAHRDVEHLEMASKSEIGKRLVAIIAARVS
jgi:phosphopantothenoylcysteine decarboxylase/phosphopantothenate--cysteine ligase